jgi:hypothetical protein
MVVFVGHIPPHIGALRTLTNFGEGIVNIIKGVFVVKTPFIIHAPVSFSKISPVKPSATPRPSSITIVRGNNPCTSLISCGVIGSLRSKLVNVFRARIKPYGRLIQNHGKHGSNGDAVLPACIKKRRVEHLAETIRAANTQPVTLDGFR